MKKIAIITGANSGLGFLTTKRLVRENIRVIMAVRNKDKGHAAKEKILAKYNNASLDVLEINLSNQDSIRKFVYEVKSLTNQIDILINNASIMTKKIKFDDKGNELQFSTNYLGHFLLTSLLFPLFPDTTNSRIIYVSSIAHKLAKLNFNDLTCRGNVFKAYAQSKLACLMISSCLDLKIHNKNKNIRSIAVHPGASNTKFIRNVNSFLRLIFRPLLKNEFTPCDSIVFSAIDENALGGRYYGPKSLFETRGEIGVSSRSLYSSFSEIGETLWDMSEYLTSEKFNI